MFPITVAWICIIAVGLVIAIPIVRFAIALATNPIGVLGSLVMAASVIAGGGGWLIWWITKSDDALFWGIAGIVGFILGMLAIGWGSARNDRINVYHYDDHMY